MFKTSFKPYHINATNADFAGNDGIGRYVLLPGSDGRAQEIAEHFDHVSVKHHPRNHNVYFGTLTCDGRRIDVATVSTGMGCASAEIILHELFHLGAKRFLRVGTASTLQPNFIKEGSLVNVQASVRDEGTTRHYAPLELPAIASLEFVTSILVAAEKLGMTEEVHTGIVHCKSSLYAREFAAGPRAPENQAYVNLLVQSGVLASEMETATLFIQTQLYNYQLMQQGDMPQNRVLAGAILAIIDSFDVLEEYAHNQSAINNSTELAIECVKILATQELIL